MKSKNVIVEVKARNLQIGDRIYFPALYKWQRDSFLKVRDILVSKKTGSITVVMRRDRVFSRTYRRDALVKVECK